MPRAGATKERGEQMARLREPGRERLMGADNAATSSTAEEPGATTIAEVTPDNMIRELERARSLAITRGQASAAVTATLAKARLAGLLNERGESNAEPSAKFDGNYAEAARRISLLLRLANRQMTRVKSIE
jgi:hypothetical protein